MLGAAAGAGAGRRTCRGHIAGIDIKEQLKKRSEFYHKLLEERQTEDQKMRAG